MTNDVTLPVKAGAAPGILLNAKTATNAVFNLVNSDEVNEAVLGDEKLEVLQDRIINRLINSEKDLMSIRNTLRKQARKAKSEKAEETQDPQAAADQLVAEATGTGPKASKK